VTLYSLVLASSSPRRAQLLQSAGIPFTLAPSPFEEPLPTPDEEKQPSQFVERLAQCKAASCHWEKLPSLSGTPLVLAADTIVWHEGKILGKPRDEMEARAMLSRLSGQSHQVFTGVCLRRRSKATNSDEFVTAHEATRVSFHQREIDWIARYVATGEPMDKAGAYAAQGKGSFLLARIEGDFSNVVGLPLGLLGRLFDDWKINYQSWWDNKF
jgi:septum formation protein